MGAQALSSRAIMGMYFERLATDPGIPWINAISNYFTSDQASESYPWLNAVPALREWIGGRQLQNLGSAEVTIANKEFEAGLEILIRDLRRDKTGQLAVRIGELVSRSNTHWASLLSSLIVTGESTVCYDGQFFFDTDHSEGSSGAQSNDITTDISAVPAQVHGAAAATPSPEEMQYAIQASITAMQTLVDDQGEPINETANSFHVVVPNGLSVAARSALTVLRAAGPATVDMDGFQISMSVNPRLTTAGWTDKFLTVRGDGDIKPFIRQEEYMPKLAMKDENSEFAFDHNAIQVGIDTSRNVGFGRWQGAMLNTLV